MVEGVALLHLRLVLLGLALLCVIAILYVGHRWRQVTGRCRHRGACSAVPFTAEEQAALEAISEDYPPAVGPELLEVPLAQGGGVGRTGRARGEPQQGDGDRRASG